jgi:ATP-binding cassette subfamily C protein
VVLFALSLGAYQFIVSDSLNAIIVLATFLIVASRMVPALARLYSNNVIIRSVLGSARQTLDFMQDYWNTSLRKPPSISLTAIVENANTLVSVSNMSFTYRDDLQSVLTDIELEIHKGDHVAIVGPTGSGKSTLLNLILGLYTPTQGQILIGRQNPVDFVKSNPGYISFIPQEIPVINGTLRENILLGYTTDITDDYLMNVIRLSNLHEFIERLPEGLDTLLSDYGSNISGGEKQRIGIARSLITAPKILVLDEATSALDAQTEFTVQENIQLEQLNLTTITVAHRISTIKHCNLIIYLENGKIVSKGTFSQVKLEVPNFEEQSRLMGL